MSSTSSYFIKKDYTGASLKATNSVCFATFNNNVCYESYVIVEKCKIDNEEKFLKYLNIINTFTFIKKIIKVKNGYHIYLNTTYRWDSALTTMLIRYVWEGRYTETKDKFYKIYDLFMDLIERIPQEDYLPLFLFCNNYTLCQLTQGYNSNHCLALGGYGEHTTKFPKSISSAKLLKQKGTTSGVSQNGFFEMMPKSSFNFIECNTTEEFKKFFEDYQKL